VADASSGEEKACASCYTLLTDSSPQNGEAWWEEIDFDTDTFTALRPGPGTEDLWTKTYSQLMQKYFDRRSRTLSPSPNKAASMWYSAPACLSDHDFEIVNIFLNLFSRNVPKCFRLFQNLNITPRTRPDYVLAAAAIGGLHCTTTGSFEFSRVMYDDSRRLLLASVSQFDSDPESPTLIPASDKISQLVQEESAELRKCHDDN